MSFLAAAVVGGVASLGAAGIGAYASSAATSASLGQQNALYQQGFNQNKPFVQAGQDALPTLSKLLTPGPDQTATLSQLPGFQFAQDWGQKAVQNIGSTQGFGGNTLTAGAKFATGLAQQGFGQYAGLLQGLVNTGANAANAGLGASVTAGSNMGNTAAAGILGTGNALAGGLTGAANAGTNALLLSKLFPNGGVDTSQPNNGTGIYTGDPTIPGFG